MITRIERASPMIVSDDTWKTHMGVRIGLNVFVMHDNPIDENCRYIVVVDTITGERIRIRFG